MTKADLVAKMADSAGITKAAAEKALAGFLQGRQIQGRQQAQGNGQIDNLMTTSTLASW